MSRLKKDIGDFGENAALEYLKGLGYTALAQKYYTRHGELDIVANTPDGRTTVFVEVKTRRGKKYGTAAQSVSRTKIKRMISAARQYAYENPSECEYRFDVIEVYYESTPPEINHIENAVYDISEFTN